MSVQLHRGLEALVHLEEDLEYWAEDVDQALLPLVERICSGCRPPDEGVCICHLAIDDPSIPIEEIGGFQTGPFATGPADFASTWAKHLQAA